MKRLINLANFGPTLDKFKNEHDNLDNFLKNHQIDAVELILYEEDIKV